MFRPTAHALTRPLRLAPRRTLPTTYLLLAQLHTTPILPKRASKPAKGDHHHVPTNVTPPPVGTFDFDEHFASLGAELAKILERLKDDLSKLRTGRVDPASFESVVVTIDKATGATALLRDVAHVVPRGRAMAVTVYEAANVKKVITAIQKADLNVTPIVDAKNPNLLNMPLPPPTKESRMAIVDAAGKAGEKASTALRNARQGSHKKIKGLKNMRIDDVRKADKQLEKIMEKAGAEMKKIVEGAKKAITEA